METPPVIPPEQVKEKLSSLGINPNQVSSTGNATVVGSSGKKPPVFLTVITLVLLLAAIAGGIFLVQKRQEIRRKAQEVTGDIDPCSDGPGGCCNHSPGEPGYDPNCDCRFGGGYNEECTKNNPACTSGKSCCSKAGCTQDSDCCTNNCNEQTQTCIGAGYIECFASTDGVRINNHTGGVLEGKVKWFASWCDDPTCGCQGTSTEESITIENEGTWSRGMTNEGPPVHCSWQSDIEFPVEFQGGYTCKKSGSGCEEGCDLTPTPTATRTPTPTPTRSITPTPTPTGRLTPTPTTTPLPGLTCVDLTMNPQPPIKIGDSVVFTCSTDRATNPLFDHFDYRLAIDSGTWQTPVGWQEIKGSTPVYKIDKADSYRIQCRVCGLEHQCTAWGGAVINSL